MAVDQEGHTTSVLAEASYNARHQVPNDYEIADSNPETLDGNCRIEYDGGVGVGDLR